MNPITKVNDKKYVFKAHQGQWKALKSTARFILLLAGTQSGKALDENTEIPTPSGFVKIKDLKKGDLVYDENGNECSVTGKFGPFINDDCYKLTFDDKSTTIADAEHLWKVQSYKQRKNQARQIKEPDPSWTKRPQCQRDDRHSVLSTEELLKEVKASNGGSNWSISINEPVKYPERDLPIKPYILGAWLGDGSSRSPYIFTEDQEVVKQIKALGIKTEKRERLSKNTGKAKCYALGNIKRGGNDRSRSNISQGLYELNLLQNKHIPDIYLTASISQRVELLRGLCDTDGYATDAGRVEFTTTNEPLATGFLELVRSLGIKVKAKKGKSIYDGKVCGDKWRITFYTSLRVFHIERKYKKQNKPKRSDVFNRYIRKIEKVESRPTYCISVSSDNKMFLAGRNYITTHNTILGPIWLKNEIKRKGSGDYIVAAPTYPLMQKKVLPEFLKIFKEFGNYRTADRIFELDTGGIKANIFFGHAQDPDSLESATAKGAWCDEAGQKKFKYGSWEAIIRRLSIHQGRALITTTPYTLGWLKNELHDKADGDYIELIQFDSRMNPAFPDEEYYRQKERMPGWKFNMMYKGIFTRPAGMIYDCFDDDNLCKRFSIPEDWKRFLGVDFGGVNTVAVKLAEDPETGKYYIYDFYKDGGKTAKQHANAIQGSRPFTAYGGSWSEDQWRDEFKAGGLKIHKPPIKDVEVGIDRVYAMFKANKLIVFDDLMAVRNDIESYSRELDEEQQPTEKIEDKETFHICDGIRYIASYIEGHKPSFV